MRKNLKYNIIGLVLVLVGIVSCNTAEQEVSPVISPDNKPVVSFSASATAVEEGDTMYYTITLDKAIEQSLTFSVLVSGDATVDSHDYEIGVATISPWETEAELMIVCLEDNFPEVTEHLTGTIRIASIAEKYLVHTDTEYPEFDITFTNVNNPARITIALGWDTPNDDIDLFAIYDGGAWGLAGTSANPEIMMDIWPDDPDGTYYVTIDPYYVEGDSFDYTFSIGYPDQTVEFFYGTFDMTALDTYTVDYFDYWDVNSYRLLEVVLNGGTITVTHVNE